MLANDSLSQIAAKITQEWQQAWNDRDALRMGQLIADDANWVTVTGRQLKGREQVQSVHAELFAGPLSTTSWASRVVTAQSIAEDVALATYTWTVSGELGQSGEPKPARNGIFTWLLQSNQGKWYIRSAHATNVLGS